MWALLFFKKGRKMLITPTTYILIKLYSNIQLPCNKKNSYVNNCLVIIFKLKDKLEIYTS